MWIGWVSMMLIADTSSGARLTLEAAAREAGAALTRGGIVTAERTGGETRFAVSGRPLGDGPAVPPERVVFEIGSISKVFTGLLLAQAVVDGKLSLDDPISRHLPASVRFSSPAVAELRLSQLATHTSCLPRLPPNLGADPDPYAAYDATALYEFLATATLEGAPPCRADYSNLGMGLLGHILERAYGTSWAELVAAHIARPLGLADTTVDLSDDQRRRLAPPWSNGKPDRNWTFRALAGAGALRSTAADLVAFAAALEKPGGPLSAAWKLASEPRADMNAIGARIGLGVLIEERDGARWYGHDGGTGGYRSLLAWTAGGAASRVVLINETRIEPESIVLRLHAGAATAERREIALPAAVLDDYVGVYEMSRQARLTVVREGAGLRVRLTGQPFFPVFAWERDRVFWRVVPAEASFVRDDKGRVVACVLHQNGRDMRAERTAAAPGPILFPSAADLEPFLGSYAFAPGAVLTLTRQRDTLFAQLTGQGAYPVFMTAPDRFVYDVVDAALEFERDAASAVVAVKLHQNGTVQRAARDASR